MHVIHDTIFEQTAKPVHALDRIVKQRISTTPGEHFVKA